MADLNSTLDPRHAVAREATYQISSMLVALFQSARRDDDSDQLHLLLLATLPRLMVLNDAVMQSFDSDKTAMTLEELHLDVTGHYHLLALKGKS